MSSPAVLRIFPQQRKLMGSSAQISSGVRLCGLQAQVPEGFRRVPQGSGVCWCRFRRQVPESFGIQRVPECWRRGAGANVPEGLGRFRKVPEGSRESSARRMLEGFAT